MMTTSVEFLRDQADQVASLRPELHLRRLNGQYRLMMATAITKAFDLGHMAPTAIGIDESYLPESSGLSSTRILELLEASDVADDGDPMLFADVVRLIEALRCRMALSVSRIEDGQDPTPLIYLSRS